MIGPSRGLRLFLSTLRALGLQRLATRPSPTVPVEEHTAARRAGNLLAVPFQLVLAYMSTAFITCLVLVSPSMAIIPQFS